MPIRSFCCPVDVMSRTVFFINLNSTFGSLRKELSRKGVYFARSNNLGNADSVYGTTQCRRYLSTAKCMSCFDVGVSILTARCTTQNGAYVILDDCFIRWVLNYYALSIWHFRSYYLNNAKFCFQPNISRLSKGNRLENWYLMKIWWCFLGIILNMMNAPKPYTQIPEDFWWLYEHNWCR